MTKGRIAAARGRFSGICQVAPMCTLPNVCFLRFIQSKLQMASRLLQPFLHRSWQKILIFYSGPPFSPTNCPFALGDLDPLLIHVSLVPAESTSQTTCRLVQPFLQSLLGHGKRLYYVICGVPHTQICFMWSRCMAVMVLGSIQQRQQPFLGDRL